MYVKYGLADRLQEIIVENQVSEQHRPFIESRDFFFLTTVDHRGYPTCSYKGGNTGLVRDLQNMCHKKGRMRPLRNGSELTPCKMLSLHAIRVLQKSLVVPLLQKNMVLCWWMASVDLYKVFNTKKPFKARFALFLSNSEHHKNSAKRSSTFLFRTHARLSRARVSNTLLSWVEIWVRPPRILYGLTHYRGEKSASFINWKIETVGECYWYAPVPAHLIQRLSWRKRDQAKGFSRWDGFLPS